MRTSPSSTGWAFLLVIMVALRVVFALDVAPFGQAPVLVKVRSTPVKDTGNNDKGETFTHVCEYVDVRDVEQTLRIILKDADEAAKVSQPEPNRNPTTTPPLVKLPRSYHITSDRRSNTVFVTGPVDVIALAKAVAKKMDTPGPIPIVCGWPIQTYAVPGGNAEEIAKKIQEVYKGSDHSVRVIAVGNTSIMVYAPNIDQTAIVKLIGP